jgi:transcriptional regulator with XRE-family HTH domain
MKLRGLSAIELSKRAGLGLTYVSDILSQKHKSMNAVQAKKLAQVLGITLDQLLDDILQPTEEANVGSDLLLAVENSTDSSKRHKRGTFRDADYVIMPVVGVAETGVIRNTNSATLRRSTIAGSKSRIPDAKTEAIEVRDLAMDKTAMGTGSYALVVRLDGEAATPIFDGMIALVGIRHDNGVETIIRRVSLSSEHCDLLAESSVPKSYPTITVDRLTTDPKEKIYVIGQVYCGIQYFDGPYA